MTCPRPHLEVALTIQGDSVVMWEVQNNVKAWFRDPWPGVLDFLGCRNKVAQPRGLTQQTSIFSEFWRLASPKLRFLGSCSQYGLSFWLAESGCLLIVSSHSREWKSKLPGVSSYGDTSSLMRAHSSCPHLNPVTSQRLCFQIPSHWRVGLQHRNFRGGHNLVHNSWV